MDSALHTLFLQEGKVGYDVNLLWDDWWGLIIQTIYVLELEAM